MMLTKGSKLGFLYRSFTAIFHYIWIYLIVGLYGLDNCFKYLSFHSLVLASWYFTIGSMLSLSSFLFPTKQLNFDQSRVRGFFELAFCVLHSIVHPLAWFVSLFYWTAVYDASVLFSYPDPIHLYLNGIFGHIINVLFLVGDLYLATCHPLYRVSSHPRKCKRVSGSIKASHHSTNTDEEVVKVDVQSNKWRLIRALLPIAVFTIYESYVIISFDFFDTSLPYGSLVSIITNGKGQFIWSQLIPFLLFLKSLIFGFHLLTNAILRHRASIRNLAST
jgi:hypothetical protein